MPRMSYEGAVGAVIALVVVTLDQAGIRNPYVLWIAFALALGLCLDAAIRSEASKRRKWVTSIIVAVIAGFFAVYLLRHGRSVELSKAATPTFSITQAPHSQQPPATSPLIAPPKSQPTIAKDKETLRKPKAAKTVSTSGPNSPATGSITQGAGSAVSINQQGGYTAGTINITQPPISFNYDGSRKRTVRGGDNLLEDRDPDPRIAKIQAEITDGDNKQALVGARMLSDTEPLWATPHVLAGLAYVNLGNPAEARRELERARALVPSGSEFEDDYTPHFENLEYAIKRQEGMPQ